MQTLRFFSNGDVAAHLDYPALTHSAPQAAAKLIDP